MDSTENNEKYQDCPFQVLTFRSKGRQFSESRFHFHHALEVLMRFTLWTSQGAKRLNFIPFSFLLFSKFKEMSEYNNNNKSFILIHEQM